MWDGKDHKASSTPKNQEGCLTYSSPNVLIESQIAQVCRNFNNAKDELREVDIHAKTADIQAQSIIEQTC